MRSDKTFGSGAVETSLFKDGEFRGDDIKARATSALFVVSEVSGNKAYVAHVDFAVRHARRAW